MVVSGDALTLPLGEPMKVSLDRSRCEGYGFCVDAAPEIFGFDDDDELLVHHEDVPAGLETRAAAAVRTCPVAALTVDS